MGEKQLNNINLKKEEETKKTPWTNKLPGASDELEAKVISAVQAPSHLGPAGQPHPRAVEWTEQFQSLWGHKPKPNK